MNDLNTQTLYDRYPRLYQRRFLSLQESAMSWGFTCGDGWFTLIDQLSAQIEAECQKLRDEGWTESELPVAVQVKSKFGRLRFRLSTYTPALREMVRAAADASEQIDEDEPSYQTDHAHQGHEQQKPPHSIG